MLSLEKELGQIYFQNSARHGHIILEPSEMELSSSMSHLFLFSKARTPMASLTKDDIKPKAWGWITVRLGQFLVKSDEVVLLFSEITSEDHKDAPIKPVQYVRWLRKLMLEEAYAGVIGRNINNGGQSDYRNLHYSPEALEMLETGTVWKQFVDGAIVFEPLLLSEE